MPLYQFNIPSSNKGNLSFSLSEGNTLFVLGANGTGKSVMMHNLFMQNPKVSKKIMAHRQNWLASNALDLTANSKMQQESYFFDLSNSYQSRWKDEAGQSALNIILFNLINAENTRSRKIAKAHDNNNLALAQSISEKKGPINDINELLKSSNIPIIISIGANDALFASKNGGNLYSIAELSDGEKNALLICADILTVPSGTILVLDEPEKHLHRSIVSPLLTALFKKRDDCIFIISSHDVLLPLDHPDASVLLLRSCEWNNQQIRDWDLDLIPATDNIPEKIKQDILGAKRNILFVEGDYGSLDKQIYQLLYPSFTITPQTNCVQVEKSVNGIRNTQELHWINAYGLIDADDRTQDQITQLASKGIAALPCYSVESLYYNPQVIKLVAERFAPIIGANSDDLYQQAIARITSEMNIHKDRLCARLCEKTLRDKIMRSMPNHATIVTGGNFNPIFDLTALLHSETQKFDAMITSSDIEGLINRYPIRETGALTQIVSGLGLTRIQYEAAVRALILDKTEIKDFFLHVLLPDLTSILGS